MYANVFYWKKYEKKNTKKIKNKLIMAMKPSG